MLLNRGPVLLDYCMYSFMIYSFCERVSTPEQGLSVDGLSIVLGFISFIFKSTLLSRGQVLMEYS